VDLSTDTVNLLNTQTFNFSVAMCPTLTSYVQSVSVPGVTLGEAGIETPFVRIPEPGDKLTYSVLGVSFLVDEEMKNWLEIFDWMTSLGYPDNLRQFGNIPQARRAAADQVRGDMVLLIYSNQSVPVLKVTFKDAFPIAVGDIPFTSTDTGNEAAIATADFMYRTYIVEPYSV
jgi:hypothetical protein